jgi:hypothetical protein
MVGDSFGKRGVPDAEHLSHEVVQLERQRPGSAFASSARMFLNRLALLPNPTVAFQESKDRTNVS